HFPKQELPISDLLHWIQLLETSKNGNSRAFTYAKHLLNSFEGPWPDYYADSGSGQWLAANIETGKVFLLGEEFSIGHKPTLRILVALSDGSEERPVPSSKLKQL